MSANHNHQGPNAIPLSAGDKIFLIPETEDMTGTHFPMSIIVCATLKQEARHEDVVNALREVNRRFPPFRLGYRLDPAHDRLVRIPDHALSGALADCVVRMDSGDNTLAGVLSALLQENNTPISQPLMIGLFGPNLIIRMHHSFGDGKLLFHILSTVLLALLKPDVFHQLPDLPPHYGLPMWRVVYQSPGQALRVFTKWIKTLRGSVQEYQRDMTETTSASLEPIKSGTAMQVRLKTLSPEIMTRLNTLRKKLSGQEKITLNTLLQVLFAQRLHVMGLVRFPVLYTLPVDLHRYVNDPDAFYPGNVSGQLRVRGNAELDLQAEVNALQRQIKEHLDDLTPLSTLPSEWLLMLAGKKTYKNVNRTWLNASTNTDPRFFILSNLGSLDERFAALADSLQLAEGIFGLIPLMGGPHLVICANTVLGQGNIAVTFDPRVLNDSHIDTLFEGLVHELAD